MKPTSVPPPTTAAAIELRSKQYTILRKEISLEQCARLRASATREDYEMILGDKLRLHARNASDAPLAARLIERVSTACCNLG